MRVTRTNQHAFFLCVSSLTTTFHHQGQCSRQRGTLHSQQMLVVLWRAMDGLGSVVDENINGVKLGSDDTDKGVDMRQETQVCSNYMQAIREGRKVMLSRISSCSIVREARGRNDSSAARSSFRAVSYPIFTRAPVTTATLPASDTVCERFAKFTAAQEGHS